MKTIHFSYIAFALILIVACNSSRSTTSSGKTGSPDKMENLNPAVDLADHLRRIPGVQVTGSGSSARATIRGMASFNSDSEPLYVINGTPINGGLATASSMISVVDIKSVRVLKTPSETSFYGIRGSNGVIVIQLKQ
ncbi:MAG: TonB-dependent receptor plug domain-containing protein [Saprospiraceae bacterium]